VQREHATPAAGIATQQTSAIPVDPGAHTIEASGVGRQAYKATITIAAKPGTQTVQVPALAAAAAPEVGVTGTPRGFWTTQRIAGASVGGAGAVGLVIGAVLGGVTLSKTSESKAHCSFAGGTYCDPAGLALRSDAKALAKGADAALAIGGAAMIAGIVVIFTAPAGEKPTSGLHIRAGSFIAGAAPGLALNGEW
jgi:hypothetical protein